MSRHRILWISLLVIFAALLIARGPDIFDGLTTKTLYIHGLRMGYLDGESVSGWYTRRRWTRNSGQVKHGVEVVFYDRSGYRAIEHEWIHGRCVRETYWNLDGTLREQARNGEAGSERRTSEPWWPESAHQSAPSAPWLAERITAEEWGERRRGAASRRE